MKVLLIRPDHQEYSLSNRSLGIVHQPLGVLYLAAALEKAGHRPIICDEMVGDDTNEMLKLHKPDLVGITVTTLLFERVQELTKLIKKEKIKVILGGPHVCALPRESIDHSQADGVVIGEGEETIVEIANGDDWNIIKGLSYYKDGKWTQNAIRPAPDIDKLPFPARHLLDRKKYQGEHEIGFSIGRKKNLLRMFTSRGCPFQCSFCSSSTIFGRRSRFRSVPSIMEEINQGLDNWETDNLMFMDDTITLKKKHITGICESIIQSGRKVKWGCFSRAGISEDVLKLMKQAGCHLIGFGVESGSQKILNKLKKNITIEEIEESLKLCKKYKIRSKAFIMVGVPDETREDFQKTVDLCLRAKPDYISVSIFTPLPGSELMTQMHPDTIHLYKSNFWKSEDPEMQARQMELLRRFHFRFDYFTHFVRNFSFKEMPDYMFMLNAFMSLIKNK